MTGAAELVRNLRMTQGIIAASFESGMVAAGLFVQRESQMLVPVDTGALRGSAFTRKTNQGMTTMVQVGYTTSYAIFVHEMVENYHHVGQAKFLEVVLKDSANRKEIFDIVRSHTKIG